MMLTSEQIAQFNRDGYVMMPELFDAHEMDLLVRIAKADRSMQGGGWIMKDAAGGESKLSLSNDLSDDIYSAISCDARIVQPMEQLLGGPVYHWHHKMMLKEPYVGGAWEWHQDYGYWYMDHCLLPTMASCMIAVDRASRDNGCLQVIRGSHRIGRVEHGASGGQTGADMDRVNEALQRMELVYCEMTPGTALFFHGNLLHRSDQNRSPNSRWSLICCYNTLDNAPFKGPGRGRPERLEATEPTAVKEAGQRHWTRLQEPAKIV